MSALGLFFDTHNENPVFTLGRCIGLKGVQTRMRYGFLSARFVVSSLSWPCNKNV